MTDVLYPAIIMIFGALLIPVTRGRARQAVMLIVPLLAFANLVMMPEGPGWTHQFLGYELVFNKVDRLSKVFGYIFTIMAFGGALYSINFKGWGEYTAAFVYVGSALGVVFAGDLLSLYFFWEMMAIASTCVVWSGTYKETWGAGLRYIIIHILGGLFLLIGIVLYIGETGSIAFGNIGLSSVATWFILLGFATNAAVPPLSAWLSDAYPESSVTGTVFLSAFTSKTAVYVLCRAFPGTELLIWAGLLMTIYGIIFAILENDMRKVLCYSIINQVGFMVAGIGIGTELSINGAASHAFAHILYKALLLMSAGSVLYMTGKRKCTDLGGLWKTMPLTLIFGLVGAAAISAVPWTGGFVSKSMIISAAGHERITYAWLILNVASAGVFLHAGIKFPYFVFFAKDSGMRPKEPPLNMLLAMGLMSFFCIFVGVFPGFLYDILPYPVDYVPYTASHVISQMQILLFSALAFFVLLKALKRTDTISLDTDWLYRKGTQFVLCAVYFVIYKTFDLMACLMFRIIPSKLAWFGLNPMGVMKMWYDRFLSLMGSNNDVHVIAARIRREKAIYPGDIIKHWPIGSTIIWVTLFLLADMILYYLN